MEEFHKPRHSSRHCCHKHHSKLNKPEHEKTNPKENLVNLSLQDMELQDNIQSSLFKFLSNDPDSEELIKQLDSNSKMVDELIFALEKVLCNEYYKNWVAKFVDQFSKAKVLQSQIYNQMNSTNKDFLKKMINICAGMLEVNRLVKPDLQSILDKIRLLVKYEMNDKSMLNLYENKLAKFIDFNTPSIEEIHVDTFESKFSNKSSLKRRLTDFSGNLKLIKKPRQSSVISQSNLDDLIDRLYRTHSSFMSLLFRQEYQDKIYLLIETLIKDIREEEFVYFTHEDKVNLPIQNTERVQLNESLPILPVSPKISTSNQVFKYPATRSRLKEDKKPMVSESNLAIYDKPLALNLDTSSSIGLVEFQEKPPIINLNSKLFKCLNRSINPSLKISKKFKTYFEVIKDGYLIERKCSLYKHPISGYIKIPLNFTLDQQNYEFDYYELLHKVECRALLFKFIMSNFLNTDNKYLMRIRSITFGTISMACAEPNCSIGFQLEIDISIGYFRLYSQLPEKFAFVHPHKCREVKRATIKLQSTKHPIVSDDEA